ncbi:MAG: glycosyltransferase [Coleofasciculaceae cyanobacterium]
MGDEFDFKVITRDRDCGDAKPYGGIKVNVWQKVGKAEVLYLPIQNLSLKVLNNIINTVEPDLLYLNSFFSPVFTIKPLLLRRLRLIHHLPTVLAPRGEFSQNALGLKSLKKTTYLFLAKSLGLCGDMVFQASSLYEQADIKHRLSENSLVKIAPELPALSVKQITNRTSRIRKKNNYLNVIFLSRISRQKNLYGALSIFKEIKGDIQFSIYGPIEDGVYWEECQQLISSMPKNIEVQYQGSLAHDKVTEVMLQHDLLFLPTLGESFGYVILEALVAGCPVLISDRTPWRNLESKGVGWDIPLEQPKSFQRVIQQCLEMDELIHRQWSQRAQEYGLQYSQCEDAVEKHRILFKEAILRKGK